MKTVLYAIGELEDILCIYVCIKRFWDKNHYLDSNSDRDEYYDILDDPLMEEFSELSENTLEVPERFNKEELKKYLEGVPNLEYSSEIQAFVDSHNN